MKNILMVFLLVLVGIFAQAVTFEIMDPCTGRSSVILKNILVHQPYPSVGKFSLVQLQRVRVPFVGTEQNIESIFNTPTGNGSVESNGSLQSFFYGWCYELNGTEGQLMPSLVNISSNSDHIRWFYAYSEFKNGQWLKMCNPAHSRPHKSYCRK